MASFLTLNTSLRSNLTPAATEQELSTDKISNTHNTKQKGTNTIPIKEPKSTSSTAAHPRHPTANNYTSPPDILLTNEILATLDLYDDILSRMARENDEMLAASCRIAASRGHMARAFDDMAKARQRMTGFFERARESRHNTSTISLGSHGGGGGDVHDRASVTLSALDLQTRRWDIMRRYEQLYRERKQIDRDMAAAEADRQRDSEWIQAMFSRVAEKGLFEAPVVVERIGGEVGDDEEDDDEEEGEDAYAGHEEDEFLSGLL